MEEKYMKELLFTGTNPFIRAESCSFRKMECKNFSGKYAGNCDLRRALWKKHL